MKDSRLLLSVLTQLASKGSVCRTAAPYTSQDFE